MSMGLMANLTQIVNLVSLFIASLRWNHPRNPSDKSLVGGGGDGPASRSVGWLNLARCAPPVRAGSAARPPRPPSSPVHCSSARGRGYFKIKLAFRPCTHSSSNVKTGSGRTTISALKVEIRHRIRFVPSNSLAGEEDLVGCECVSSVN